MKKKMLTLVIGVLCLSFAGLAACTDNPKNSSDSRDSTYSSDSGDTSSSEEQEAPEAKYAVSFDSKGGSAVAATEAYFNQYLLKPADPVRDGYRFTGWYYDADCTKLCEFIYTRMPSHALTFYAGWKELNHIAFETNGGSAVAKLEGLAGDEITVDDLTGRATSKDGYIFEGWYTDEAFTEEYVFYKYPTENVTVYAKWRAKNASVRVTLSDDGVTRVLGTYAETTAVQLADDLTRAQNGAYYDFVGWALDEKGSKMVDFEYAVPSRDITLYAIYRKKADYAYITINGTKYNAAVGFFAKKGELMSGVSVSLPDYEDYTSIVDTAAIEAQSLVYNGFISTKDLGFDPRTDVVVSDMELNINLYSEGLNFDAVYTHLYNGGYYYGLKDVAAYYGKQIAQLTDVDMSAFEKVYYMVAGYAGDAEDVFVPKFFSKQGDQSSYKVIMVTEGAFKDAAFSSISLPDGMMIIEAHAFENCVNLESIVLPHDVTEIYDSAFKGCARLSSVTINPELRYLGYRIFEGTAYENKLIKDNPDRAIYLNNGKILYLYNAEFAVKSVVTASKPGVVGIAGGAFENKANLMRVTISNDVVFIGAGAFKNCPDLETVVWGKQLQYIMAEAFRGCTKLETADGGNNKVLKEIGAYAFEGCTSLTYFFIPEKMTKLGEGAFMNCSSLATVKMYYYGFFNNVTNKTEHYTAQLAYIPEKAFAGCTGLTDFEVMDYVTEVAKDAFRGCEALKNVAVGYTQACVIKKIDAGAFAGCKNLSRIIISRLTEDPDECVAFEDGCFDEASLSKLKLYISASYYGTYKEAMADSQYLENLSTWDSNAPKIELLRNEYTIDQTYGYDVLALVTSKIARATDDNTAPEDLVFSISSVLFGETTLVADKDGHYDFLTAGRYVVKFKVTDEFGRSASSSFTIIATENAV